MLHITKAFIFLLKSDDIIIFSKILKPRSLFLRVSHHIPDVYFLILKEIN